jgi:hypothetical protein
MKFFSFIYDWQKTRKISRGKRHKALNPLDNTYIYASKRQEVSNLGTSVEDAIQ